jgi:hypothetical protein
MAFLKFGNLGKLSLCRASASSQVGLQHVLDSHAYIDVSGSAEAVTLLQILNRRSDHNCWFSGVTHVRKKISRKGEGQPPTNSRHVN